MIRPVDLAGAVLALHMLVIAFNLFGLIATPVGGWLGWRFVRIGWWRVLHALSFAIVAIQAVAGRACFLTVWQAGLDGGEATPLIMRWINSVVYWPLPIWVFAALYVALFAYVLALFKFVPVRRF